MNFFCSLIRGLGISCLVLALYIAGCSVSGCGSEPPPKDPVSWLAERGISPELIHRAVVAVQAKDWVTVVEILEPVIRESAERDLEIPPEISAIYLQATKNLAAAP